MNSPCYKDCQRRSITCHSNCKEYSDWVTEEKEKKNKIREAKQGGYIEYKSDVIRRTTGKKKWQI